jgi:hypothetical protein
VHRESLEEISYGPLAPPGEGEDTHGEIDGVGNWAIAAYVRYPGNEEQASAELSQLAWNLLRVLRGYTKDSTGKYGSLRLVRSEVQRMEGRAGEGWFLGEKHTARVRWEMSF